jgi:hypothetical protein
MTPTIVSLDQRKALEEDGVDHRKDRGIDPDAQGGHPNEDDREAGTFSKRAQPSPRIEDAIQQPRSADLLDRDA